MSRKHVNVRVVCVYGPMSGTHRVRRFFILLKASGRMERMAFPPRFLFRRDRDGFGTSPTYTQYTHTHILSVSYTYVASLY